MKIHAEKTLLMISLCLLALAGCKSASTFQPESFHGMVYNLNNEPVNGLTVSLFSFKDAESVPEFKVLTDIHGHFNLGALKTGTTYKVDFEKKGYEKKSTIFTYSDPGEILYVKICSGEQYIQLAEAQIKSGNYSEAQKLLQNAENAGANLTVINYLLAVINYKQKNYEIAAAILEKLIEDGSQEAHINLFLADIYQYNIKNMEKAKYHLQHYAHATYDPVNEQRMNELIVNGTE